jgi:hypothetical protein
MRRGRVGIRFVHVTAAVAIDQHIGGCEVVTISRVSETYSTFLKRGNNIFVINIPHHT